MKPEKPFCPRCNKKVPVYTDYYTYTTFCDVCGKLLCRRNPIPKLKSGNEVIDSILEGGMKK